jgi:threonine dehydrogenase-like Zn-dependent dehydrogenase
MKTIVYKESAKPLVIEEQPDPTPEEGQVVIKVGRCGICGSDTNCTTGGPFDFPLGSAMGHEYAGEVVALGKRVKHLKVGDKITALPMQGCGHCLSCLQGYPFHCSQLKPMMGGFGEYTLVAESSSVKLPEGLSLADGALVEPLSCGLRAVSHAGIKPGSKVLVIGAGSIGSGVVYWARRSDAGKIGVTARTKRHEQLALAMGADFFLPAHEELPQQINAALGGPPDVVFECAGASGTIAQAIDLVRSGGLVMVAGMCTHPDQFIPALAMWKEVKINFACAYSIHDFQHAVDVFGSGALEPRALISETIGLEQVPEMVEKMRKPHNQCKVMVDPWS